MKNLGVLILLLVGLVAAAAESSIQVVDVNGRLHRPLEDTQVKATVLFFIAPDCPISNAYVPEINRIVAEYQTKQTSFYLVYVDPDQKPAVIKKHLEQYKLTPPALLDPKHLLVKKTAAKVTPEVAVVLPGGNTVYHGRIDDLFLDFGKRQEKPRERNLRDALDAVLSGQPIATPVTTAIGCYMSEIK